MRHSRKFIASAIAALAILASCGGPKVEAGTVTAKVYDPPYVTSGEICSFYGKYGCQVWVPTTDHHDAQWKVKIDGTDKDGHARVGWRTVPAETYDACNVGDFFRDNACSAQG